MKGVLVLTERRSGSEWLGSLATSTGVLGRSGEWFANYTYGKAVRTFSEERFIAEALSRSSTDNGFFYIKLFPAHVHWFHITYGTDIIRHFLNEHDVTLVSLRRRERFRQAISYAKALQTTQWRSDKEKSREPEYDFEQICRCFFLIGSSYAYWDSYLQIRGLDCASFTYEDLVADPAPYIDHIAAHAGVSDLPPAKAGTRVQSDRHNDAWLERFRADVAERGIVGPSAPSRMKQRSPSNLIRLVRGRPLKPYPYAY